MPTAEATFCYTARDASGQLLSGVIEACGSADAVAALSSRGWTPLHVAQQSQATRRWLQPPTAAQRMAWYAQLSDLQRSGVPFLRCLEIVSAEGAQHEVLDRLRQRVAGGASLSHAMTAEGNVFPDLDVHLVRAGEEGGFLEESLQRLAEHTERQQEVRTQTLSALVYPVFLLSAAILVVLGLMIFVVPQFANLFSGLAAAGKLPAPTVAILGLHAVLVNYGFVLLAIAFLAVGVGFWLLKSPAWVVWRDQLLLRLPVVGTIHRDLALARWCRTLGSLLDHGVGIVTSQEIAGAATGNKVLERSIRAATESLTGGHSLVAPLRQCPEFPASLLEAIAVGEEANTLGRVLTQSADRLERRAQSRMQVAIKLLEPLLLVVMALVVLFIVLALQLPLLELGTGSLT